jgi:hypothetical protein
VVELGGVLQVAERAQEPVKLKAFLARFKPGSRPRSGDR